MIGCQNLGDYHYSLRTEFLFLSTLWNYIPGFCCCCCYCLIFFYFALMQNAQQFVFKAFFLPLLMLVEISYITHLLMLYIYMCFRLNIFNQNFAFCQEILIYFYYIVFILFNRPMSHIIITYVNSLLATIYLKYMKPN